MNNIQQEKIDKIKEKLIKLGVKIYHEEIFFDDITDEAKSVHLMIKIPL